MPQFHDAHVYVAFDAVIRRSEQWLRPRVASVFGYEGAAVAASLTQRIVELTLAPFGQHCIERTSSGESPGTSASINLDLAGVRLNPDSGAVRLSKRLVMKSVSHFVAFWLLTLFQVLFARRAADERPATLVFGIGIESLFVEGNDAAFIKFCQDGPIAPLERARRLFVQAMGVHTSCQPDRVFYDRSPLLSLIRSTPMSAAVRARFVSSHVAALGTFFMTILRQPILTLLSRDLAYTPIVSLLNRIGAIEAVVITNSNYSRQPLWMTALPVRRFRVHMVWYSQPAQLLYPGDPIDASLPNYRHISVDVSWVWTEAFAQYLQSLGIGGEKRCVGPILWYLPERASQRSDNEVRIAVFDVTPVSVELARKLGVVCYYYCAPNVLRFIDDIVALKGTVERVTGKPVRVLLKHKRARQPIHDGRYLDLVEKHRQAGNVDLVPLHENIYKLLDGVDLSIVIPYSAPAYVADGIGKPAIYFDATSKLLPTHLPAQHVSFAGGHSELLARTLGILGIGGPDEAVGGPESVRYAPQTNEG